MKMTRAVPANPNSIVKPPACALVNSHVIHVRHGTPQHKLARRTLSIWIDLDRLEEASQMSWLFSVKKFNLLSFYPSDFGPNHKSQAKSKSRHHDLAQYARDLCSVHLPDTKIESVYFLAMPRILGMAFNPITAYLCKDGNGDERFIIYEVHNTFGDSHSYAGVIEDTGRTMLHHIEKKLHVSPFFPIDGQYDLRFRANAETLMLLVRYNRNDKPALTATLRGKLLKLQATHILSQLISGLHFPMRPWFGIHVEAVKLFIKKCALFGRPLPPKEPHSLMSQNKNTVSK